MTRTIHWRPRDDNDKYKDTRKDKDKDKHVGELYQEGDCQHTSAYHWCVILFIDKWRYGITSESHKEKNKDKYKDKDKDKDKDKMS